jgi:hypothetical protein
VDSPFRFHNFFTIQHPRGGHLRGGVSQTFLAANAWKKGLVKTHGKSFEPDEQPQFFHLLGGKLPKSLYGQEFAFEKYARLIARDQDEGNRWWGQPLALAECFGDVFHNFAEIDWEIEEGRSPLCRFQIRRLTVVMASVLRQYVRDLPDDVQIYVCTTLTAAGGARAYRESHLKCSGCKPGRVEFRARDSLYVCSFCRTTWRREKKWALSADQQDADDNADSDDANLRDFSESESDRDDRDAATTMSRADLRRLRLITVGAQSTDATPRVERHFKQKNGLHLRCANLRVSQQVARHLRRCYIYALLTAFPHEPQAAWQDRIDPAPIEGKSLRMLGMYKKAVCHRCNGTGTLLLAHGETPCTTCPGSRGALAVDKRYGIWDVLRVGAAENTDSWLRDRAEAEQTAVSAAAASGTFDSDLDAVGTDIAELHRLRTDRTHALLCTSISNVPAGARSVQLDLDRLRRVPMDRPAKVYRNVHRGKTRETRMWDTMLTKRGGKKVPFAGDLCAVKTMLRRMFPYPRMPDGRYDMDDARQQQNCATLEQQNVMLERRSTRLAVTADISLDDCLPPSPFDESAVTGVVFTGKRRDTAFIKIAGTGSRWCPEKQRQKARGGPGAPHTAEHGSTPAYFIVSRTERWVQCRCMSKHHVCARCQQNSAVDCTHGWWSERQVDKQLMLASEWRVLFGRDPHADDQEAAAVAASAGTLADTYEFLNESWGHQPTRMREFVRSMMRRMLACSILGESGGDDLVGEPMHYCIHYALTAHAALAPQVEERAKTWARAHPKLASAAERRLRSHGRRKFAHSQSRTADSVAGRRSIVTRDAYLQQLEREANELLAGCCSDSDGDEGYSNDDPQADEEQWRRKKTKKRDRRRKHRLRKIQETSHSARFEISAAQQKVAARMAEAARSARQASAAVDAARASGVVLSAAKRSALAATFVKTHMRSALTS